MTDANQNPDFGTPEQDEDCSASLHELGQDVARFGAQGSRLVAKGFNALGSWLDSLTK